MIEMMLMLPIYSLTLGQMGMGIDGVAPPPQVSIDFCGTRYIDKVASSNWRLHVYKGRSKFL